MAYELWKLFPAAALAIIIGAAVVAYSDADSPGWFLLVIGIIAAIFILVLAFVSHTTRTGGSD